jgi:Plant mobile domain
LDLFSTVMFPNQSGYIQTMFIQFLRNITDPPRYSWGSAVLARLYRALCDTSDKTNK